LRRSSSWRRTLSASACRASCWLVSCPASPVRVVASRYGCQKPMPSGDIRGLRWHRPRKQRQPRPVRPHQPRMSTRPPAPGHSELMAQHKDPGVPQPLPPRQPQQRYRTGRNQEDQLQARKPNIIPLLASKTERSAVSGASGQLAQAFGTHSISTKVELMA